MKTSFLTLLAIVGTLGFGQTQTQNLNMGLHQLQFPSANGGNNRIQSFGGTFPGTWLFKSRFDNIILDAGENENNRFQILFKTGNVERLRIKNNGNVGIGATNPNATLQIGDSNGTGSPSDQVEIKRLSLAPVTHSGSDWFFTTRDITSFANLDIGYGTNKSITLRHDGNVGVGILNPSYRLQTNGDIMATNGWIRTTGAKGIYFNSYGGGLYMADNTWIRTYGNKNFYHNTGVMRTDGTFQVGNGGSRFLVKTNGNVGIGTTSPQARLDVSTPGGPSGTRTALRLRAGNTANYFGNTQLTLSYNGNITHTHAVKSRHNSGGVYGNSIDFYTWKPGDAVSAIGSNHVMSLNGDRVGIGTTSPQVKFHIEQDSNPAADHALLISEPNNSQKIYLHLANGSAGQFGFLHLGGQTNIRGNGQKSTFGGAVGIGTTDPSAKLDVNGSVRFRSLAQGDTPNRILGIDANGNVKSYASIATGSDDDGDWTTNGNNLHNTNLTGNVGIGTTNPQAVLHVIGKGDLSTYGGQTIRLTSKNPNGGLFLELQGNQHGKAYLQALTNGSWWGTTGPWNQGIHLNKQDNYIRFRNNNKEVLRIAENGNVGIGTTNPTALLDVSKTESYANSLLKLNYPWDKADLFQINRGSSKMVTIGNGGGTSAHGTMELFVNGQSTSNIKLAASPSVDSYVNTRNFGIGTTSPGEKLDVRGGFILGEANNAGLIKFRRGLNDGAAAGSVGFFNSGNEAHNFAISSTSGGGYISFRTNGSQGVGERMRIAYNGNVGIGSTSPQAKFHIEQTEASGLLFTRTGHESYELLVAGTKGLFIKNKTLGASEMVFDGTGNVGIGTENPTQKLTVNGKILAEEVEVVADIADYVFQKYYTGTSNLKEDYKMPTLQEVETFTKENHHLPGVPSAAEVKENGLALGDMSNRLLEKIEELTLYTIEQEKEIETQDLRLKTQEEKLEELEDKLQNAKEKERELEQRLHRLEQKLELILEQE